VAEGAAAREAVAAVGPRPVEAGGVGDGGQAVLGR
jgi:hypothetical protein